MWCRPALGPTQPPVQWVQPLLPAGNAAGVWLSPPTPSSAKVKERVELPLLHLWGLVTCSRVGFIFTFTFMGEIFDKMR
jgi:hypothetical protein